MLWYSYIFMIAKQIKILYNYVYICGKINICWSYRFIDQNHLVVHHYIELLYVLDNKEQQNRKS